MYHFCWRRAWQGNTWWVTAFLQTIKLSWVSCRPVALLSNMRRASPWSNILIMVNLDIADVRFCPFTTISKVLRNWIHSYGNPWLKYGMLIEYISLITLPGLLLSSILRYSLFLRALASGSSSGTGGGGRRPMRPGWFWRAWEYDGESGIIACLLKKEGSHGVLTQCTAPEEWVLTWLQKKQTKMIAFWMVCNFIWLQVGHHW